MLWPVLAFVGLLLLALLLGAYVGMSLLRRGLTRFAARRIDALIVAALSHADRRIQVLELDKALDVMLTELGYKGTLGEKLMEAGARFPNIDALWKGHKLRNVLAHEPGAQASDADVQQMRSAVHEALRHVSSGR